MTTQTVRAKKTKDQGRINRLIMSHKERLAESCRALSLKHEMVCQRLCDYLEANNTDDGRGNKRVPWQHRPHGDIHYYDDLKGRR